LISIKNEKEAPDTGVLGASLAEISFPIINNGNDRSLVFVVFS
jgi:hypothetical protein